MADWLENVDHALEDIQRSKMSEVIAELRDEYYLNVFMENDAYHLFKNIKKNGLFDRVEKYLGLRLDEFEKKEKQEKSDFLCFAKFLYIVEYNFPLLKILSKPSMADITVYGEKVDEDTILYLSQKLKARTTPGYVDRCDACYYELLNDWLYIRSELTNCIIDAYFSLKQQDGIHYEIPQEIAYIAAELLAQTKAKKTKEQKEGAIELSESIKSDRIKTDPHSSQKDNLSIIIEYIESEFDYIVQNIDKEYIYDLPYNHGIFDTFYTCFDRYYVSSFFNDDPNEASVGIKTSLDVENFFSLYADSAILFS